MSDNSNIEKNIAELFTVSVEFCAFINKAGKFNRTTFIDKSIKLMSLLYLKASVIDFVEYDDNSYVEKCVTEDEYNRIHALLSEKIGSFETYFDIIDGTGFDTGESVNVSVTECITDIYQDIMNFVYLYRDFVDDDKFVAVAECLQNFKSFWGIRLLRVMAELHNIRYSTSFTLDD